MSSLAGPRLSLTTTTPPTLDENGHVQMNIPRRMSLFGAHEIHMSRLPADGQAQVDSEQSSAPKPQGSQEEAGMHKGSTLSGNAWCACVRVCMY